MDIRTTQRPVQFVFGARWRLLLVVARAGNLEVNLFSFLPSELLRNSQCCTLAGMFPSRWSNGV